MKHKRQRTAKSRNEMRRIALDFAAEQIDRRLDEMEEGLGLQISVNVEVIRRDLTPVEPVAQDSDARVYLLWAEGTDTFKIGYTNRSVDTRAAVIEAYSPIPLKILACVRGTQTDERNLHKRFAEWRLHGEWFKIPYGESRNQLFACFGVVNG